MYRYIFFDLDGTLVDSRKDLYEAIRVGLLKLNLPSIEESKIYRFVGDGVTKLVERVLEYNRRIDLRENFLSVFLEYYERHIADNTKPYPGMVELLNFLKARSVLMFVVTNKSEYLAQKLLRLLGMHGYFSEIVGGDTFDLKKPHPLQIVKIMDWYGIDKQDALFVGDSENDILAAEKAGIKVGWVSYGFRGPEVLDKYKVDHVFGSPRDIEKLYSI